MVFCRFYVRLRIKKKLEKLSVNPNVFFLVTYKNRKKRVIRICISLCQCIYSRRVSQPPTIFSFKLSPLRSSWLNVFLNHPVEMCPLDDKVDTNAAAKTCRALFEVSGLMYSK